MGRGFHCPPPFPQPSLLGLGSLQGSLGCPWLACAPSQVTAPHGQGQICRHTHHLSVGL